MSAYSERNDSFHYHAAVVVPVLMVLLVALLVALMLVHFFIMIFRHLSDRTHLIKSSSHFKNTNAAAKHHRLTLCTQL